MVVKGREFGVRSLGLNFSYIIIYYEVLGSDFYF